MAEDDPKVSAEEQDALPRPASRRRWRVPAAIVGGVLLVLLVALWFQKEEIAVDFISGQLESLGVPATYEIEAIGPTREVLRNIVVGDPRYPDLTIERADIAITTEWGVPRIGRITLEKPRLYGTWRDGKLSFGSLDPVVFAKRVEPTRLPDYDIAIRDGRGLLEGDFGRAGFKIEGAGHLRGGFVGHLAAIALSADADRCRAGKASIYGRVTVTNERPRFNGPLRLASLNCEGQQLRLGRTDFELDVTGNKSLDGAEGQLRGKAAALAYGNERLAGAGANARFVWRNGMVTARYGLAATDTQTPQAALSSLSAEGVLRMAQDLSRIEVEGNLDGSGLRVGNELDSALAEAQRAGKGSLLAPLVGQIRTALLSEGKSSSLSGQYIYRSDKDGWSLVVPNARVNGTSGAPLLAVSRLQLGAGADGVPTMSGNFSTAGEGMPQIVGRMEQADGGQLAMGISLAEYRAGDARLAIPRLALVQSAGGALGFSGNARITGDLPGGRVEALELPLQGNWSAGGGFALWRRCVPLRFDSLAFANLVLQRQALSVCPPPGQAIVRSGQGGLKIAAGATSLSVSGRLGESPIRIASGPIGFAWPGQLSARSLAVELGPPATASHFRVTNLSARIGKDVSGRFSGSDVLLGAVKLDLKEAAGDWRYAGGKVAIANGSFRLSDRGADARFEPLIARDATLTLVDNVITANAVLREPVTDRIVVRTDIRHNLTNARGSADLFVDALEFDPQLQPDRLTKRAKGVVANASGTVRGTGRIDWNEDTVTSTGRFATDSLDFAAAFGPVKGASGEIVFTDLLGLVTAPDQRLRLASVNPGVEVLDGEVVYELKPDFVLEVKGGRWPFMEGTLQFQPVTMNLGATEERRYVLAIEGFDAARFVEHMEMGNIAATGIFDGTIPLIFDDKGGRIENGQLRSRDPGGNVSYVGALTYKDITPIVNYAFDALKSLDYREMRVTLNGPLEGEIITKVQMAGIKQGAAAERNFITDRFRNLPIQFNINVKAQFYQLITSLKAMYDPAFIRDPREIGLLDAEGNPIRNESVGPPLPAIKPEDIQPSESGKTP